MLKMPRMPKTLKTKKTLNHDDHHPRPSTPLPPSVADDLHRLWQHSWLNRHMYVEDPMVGDWRPRIIENDTEFYSLHPRLRDFLNDQFGDDESDSAISEDKEIQFYTALCYGVGFGVLHDLERQIRWCTRAATNGHLEAIITLAACYKIGGCGFRKDEAEAFRWYLMAAEAGDKDSQYEVFRLLP